MRLRAPGLVSEYIGSWSKSSLEWDEIPPGELERLGAKQLAEGEFW